MKKILFGASLVLLVSTASFADETSYRYNVTVVNNTNVTLSALDTNAQPVIPSTDVAKGQQAFQVHDNGRSFQIFYKDMNVCQPGGDQDFNPLDFTWQLRHETDFTVTISGYYNGDHDYQLNCLPM